MDWVKLATGYFRDLAIATVDDACEVMFTRGLAYSGEAETSGFIPAALLPALTRRPAAAARTAAKLVQAGLWERAQKGGVKGYDIVNWHEHQADLERYIARKRRDAERKRAERASRTSADTSTDTSQDSPHVSMSGEVEEELEEETAAAAAVPGRGGRGSATAGTDDGLPTAVAILASKMRAFTPLQTLRFDSLTAAQTEQILDLIDVHGDDRLLELAKTNLRTPPPVSVAAFLKSWAAAPVPGQRLAIVEARCHHCGKGQKACEAANAKVAADDRHDFEVAS